MPTCITHAVVGLGLGVAVTGFSSKRFLALSVALSTLPDLDMLGFVLGIPYDHLFGHRGITHSVFFAILASLAVVRVFFAEARLFTHQWKFYFLYCFSALFLHGMLDALTNGGEGVAFLAPFTNQRLFFQFTPIEVSPVDLLQFFDGRGWYILANEVLWIWVPLFTSAFLIRMASARQQPGPAFEPISPRDSQRESSSGARAEVRGRH